MATYAIIQTGSKQYRVQEQDVLAIERIPSVKKSFTVKEVLFYRDPNLIEVGKPFIKGAKVSCTVLGEVKDDKKVSYKYKRRKSFMWKRGHRQKLYQIRVDAITIE